MSHESVIQALNDYALAVRLDRRANPSVAGDGTALELLLTPKFQALIETILGQRQPLAPRVLPEYRKGGIGRPDLAFAREAQPARAFIELKQPANSLSPNRLRGHDADQFHRFSELPLWAFCNFHRIHLYARDDLKEEAVVLPAIALDPDTSDAQASRLVRRHDPGPFLAILEALALAGPIAPRDARDVAEALAHAARLTRRIVRDQCRIGAPPVLAEVRAEFRETLFAHAAAGGYDTSDEDELFANAFAQTLAFGLLLAREASGQEVGRDAYRTLPGGVYPLLRATLRALTQDEILDLLGVGFDILVDTTNVVSPDLLAPRAGTDPILYFYEDFLGVFDPEAKKRHGVFFTPVPIVRFMVSATDRALKNELATQGFVDPNVLLLDPACGTGTFLIAAANLVADAARETLGDGAVAGEVADLAARSNGFELLVGPYTVAHYRLLREVAAHHVVPRQRLPIFLTDTLAPPAGALGITSHLGFMAAPIVEERRGADQLKRDAPIIAIFGNPPYRRLDEGEEDAIVSGWDNGFWDDLKEPVRNAGWGGELNTFPDLYIAFWRWSLWKLFESDGASHRGVVCLITNRTFLAGHPYAGLRQMLRRRFDTIDIVDLRGDSRGARPAGIETDENVFAIQAGVCILIAVATGTARPIGAEAAVRYADVWRHDAFTARDKRVLLEATQSGSRALTFAQISRGGLGDFLPVPFEGLNWPVLPDVFVFKKSGSKSQRDELVYGFSPEQVTARMRDFSTASEAEAKKMFFPRSTRRNGTERAPTRAEVARFGRARTEKSNNDRIVEYVYRPLDRRYLYASANFVSRYGPDLIGAWGAANAAIYALPSGTGAGPAVWVHGLLCDYHSFRGSYGGYAFPLWDRRHGIDATNLSPALLAGLTSVYGRLVSAQEAFDAIIALLSATSYTRRFAWDLEETFAHIPFPAQADVFAEAVRVGSEIRLLETFARKPAEEFHKTRMAGHATGVTLAVPPVARAFLADGRGSGAVTLQEDKSLRLVGVPEPVWHFAVSGYRVLPHWLAARNGEALNREFNHALLDVVWRIAELLHWFDSADQVLSCAVDAPLSIADLGLPLTGVDQAKRVEEPDDEPSDSTS